MVNIPTSEAYNRGVIKRLFYNIIKTSNFTFTFVKILSFPDYIIKFIITDRTNIYIYIYVCVCVCVVDSTLSLKLHFLGANQINLEVVPPTLCQVVNRYKEKKIINKYTKRIGFFSANIHYLFLFFSNNVIFKNIILMFFFFLFNHFVT